MIRIKFYFSYPDGTDDTVIIEGYNDPDIKQQLDEFLEARNATFTGYEEIKP